MVRPDCPRSRSVCACLLAGAFLLVAGIPRADAQAEPKIQAKAALLIDAGTGQVLFERNADQPHPPASTTKLMTALLAYEATRLEGLVKIERSDTQVEPSHVPLVPGESVAMRDLVCSVLIGSDNDSAMAVGRAVAGSMPAFLDLMNERARQLGCRQTHFLTPNGLPKKGQITTCWDLMRIFQRVLDFPELRTICQTKSFTLRTRACTQVVGNHNRLLGKYAGMGPAKTGWTYSSRHTYAAAATREGRELYLTLLNSPNKWTDARLLFDYGFKRARTLPLVTRKPPEPESQAPIIETALDDPVLPHF